MRKYFTSFEIYDLGKAIDVPISRSVLHWFRKEKLFVPVAVLYKFFLYDRKDIVAMVQRLAENRGGSVSEKVINDELDRIASGSKVLSAIVDSK